MIGPTHAPPSAGALAIGAGGLRICSPARAHRHRAAASAWQNQQRVSYQLGISAFAVSSWAISSRNPRCPAPHVPSSPGAEGSAFVAIGGAAPAAPAWMNRYRRLLLHALEPRSASSAGGQLIRHGVARFGPVQRDDGDAVADRAEQFIGAGIDGGVGGRHGSHSPRTSRHSGAPAPDPESQFRVSMLSHRPGMTAMARISRPTAVIPVPSSRRCAAVAARSSKPAQWRRDRASNPAGRRIRRGRRCECRHR